MYSQAGPCALPVSTSGTAHSLWIPDRVAWGAPPGSSPVCFGSFSSKPESIGDKAFAVEAVGASGALGAVENPCRRVELTRTRSIVERAAKTIARPCNTVVRKATTKCYRRLRKAKTKSRTSRGTMPKCQPDRICQKRTAPVTMDVSQERNAPVTSEAQKSSRVRKIPS